MASSSSLEQLEEQVKEAGDRLLMPANSSVELINQLDKLEQRLSLVPQQPCDSMKDALIPATSALIADELLSHADMDVKVSVVSCITELSRITAPDAPYDDEKMKEIFQLTIMVFEKLSHVSGHCYSKAIQVLNTVAKVRSSLLMLDLECNALIVEMFQLFLETIRSSHPHDVFLDMETIMTLVIEESDEISFELLSPLLSSVKKENQNISPLSWKLGEKVLNNCSTKLKTHLPEVLKSARLDLNDYGEVVSSICQDSPGKEHVVDKELEPEPDVTSNQEIVPSMNGQSKSVMDNGTSSKRKHDTLGNKLPSKTLKRCQQRKKQESSDARTEPQTIEAAVTVQPEADLTISKKRDRKPNSMLKPEEGYDHYWFNSRSKSLEKTRSRKNGEEKNGNTPRSSTSKEENSFRAEAKDKASQSADVDLKEGPDIERDAKAKPIKCSKKNKLAENLETTTLIETANVVAKKEDGIPSDSEGKQTSLARTKDDKKQKRGKIIKKCVTEESGDKKLVSPSLNREESLLNEPSKRKHKRKWTPGKKQDLVTPCGTKDYGEELVGWTIKVWWPLDQMFYEGTISSFDPVDKKHKVLYVDGEEEVLNLSLERWELLGKISPGQEQAGNIASPTALSDKPRKTEAKIKPESSLKQEQKVSSPKRSKAKSSKPASNLTLGTICINDNEIVEIDRLLEDDARKSTGEQENEMLKSMMKPKHETTHTVFQCKASLPKVAGEFGTSSSKANRKNRSSKEKASRATGKGEFPDSVSAQKSETKSSLRKKRQRSMES